MYVFCCFVGAVLRLYIVLAEKPDKGKGLGAEEVAVRQEDVEGTSSAGRPACRALAT